MPSSYDLLPWLPELLNCRQCACRDEAKRVVPGVGPLDAGIAFIGQNPGSDEDEAGIPFVGESGKMLNQWIALMGLRRDRVLVTNAVKCFPGETLVEAHGTHAAFKRWYAGDLIRVVTTVGQLTGTPNHPVLTGRGWVPLGELTESDDLLRGVLSKRVGLRDPHVQGGPTEFAQFFRTATELGVCHRMVGRDVDFHGDGKETQIDVVSLDRFLGARLEAIPFEHLLQHMLESTNSTSSLLSPFGKGDCEMASMFRRLLSSTGSGVRACYQCASSRVVEALPAITKGVREVADWNARLLEDSADSPLVAAMLSGERDEAGPVVIGVAHVLRVERFQWHGDVYNLSTASEEYIANGFIVHNCHTDRNRKPRKREMDTCQDAWLRRELESFEALRVLIPLGRPALEAVVGKVEALPPVMTSWWMTASFRVEADFKEFHILPLPHPSYLLRYPTHQSRLNQLLLPGVVKYLEENFPDVYTRARR